MLADALGRLYQRAMFGMRLGLEPMRVACIQEKNPQNAFKCVHVAGTNGKGSTCAMVESIARAAGEKTGLYTSPHLARFAERIRIDGEVLGDDDLALHLERALAYDALTFFETATLAAFLAFRAHGVTLAVIEVGLGGRLDATNVIDHPAVTAITRIAIDHVEVLGPTVEAIGREKAGIAKFGVPIIIGDAPTDTREAAKEAGAIVLEVEAPTDIPSPPGSYQLANARLAWHITGLLGIDEPTRRRGITATKWPARFERIDRYLLDGAHNPDGMKALVNAVSTSPPAAIIFGALADKAWREMLLIVSALPAPRFYVAPKGRLAVAPDAMAEIAPGTPCESIDDALRKTLEFKGTVLICGSLYLIGAARATLLNLPVDPPVAL